MNDIKGISKNQVGPESFLRHLVILKAGLELQLYRTLK